MPSNFLTKSLLPKTNSSPSYRKSCVILAVRNRDQSFFCTISSFCRIILAGVWLNTSYIHILNHMIHWLQQSYRSSYVAHSKKHACQSVSQMIQMQWDYRRKECLACLAHVFLPQSDCWKRFSYVKPPCYHIFSKSSSARTVGIFFYQGIVNYASWWKFMTLMAYMPCMACTRVRGSECVPLHKLCFFFWWIYSKDTSILLNEVQVQTFLKGLVAC